MNRFITGFSSIVLMLLMSACATPRFAPEMAMSDARINPESVTGHALRWLPGPRQSISVAVYGIADETGAFKPSEGGQTLSRAVTQAPTPILIKALHDAGNRSWFDVIERENLGNLIKERQIIQEMRARYLGETELNREALPALKFAGVLIEGAITGYDTNTRTGGAGARYLGIGGSTQYREDSVSVYLRVVSVKTGDVLLSITAQQRVASVALQGDAFRFVSFQKLLEAEAGITLNQPRHMAVRQALEKAVYGLIVEGAELGLWGFGNEAAGLAAIEHYRENYAPYALTSTDGGLPPEFYQAHLEQNEQRRAQFAALQSVATETVPPQANLPRPQLAPQQASAQLTTDTMPPEQRVHVSPPPINQTNLEARRVALSAARAIAGEGSQSVPIQLASADQDETAFEVKSADAGMKAYNTADISGQAATNTATAQPVQADTQQVNVANLGSIDPDDAALLAGKTGEVLAAIGLNPTELVKGAANAAAGIVFNSNGGP